MFYVCNIFHEFADKMIPHEAKLFLWLNSHHNDFFDIFMNIYSGKEIWILFLIAALAVFTIKTKPLEAILVILAIIVIFSLCDQISSSLIKPLCMRLRPTHYPGIQELVHTVNGYRGGRYGFISSHSANGYGIATFSALLFRYKLFTFAIFLWATITVYSRIYLGVHFVSDVIAGMMLGIIVGYLVYFMYTVSRIHFLKLSESDLEIPPFNKSKAQILIYTLLAIILIIATISTVRVL